MHDDTYVKVYKMENIISFFYLNYLNMNMNALKFFENHLNRSYWLNTKARSLSVYSEVYVSICDCPERIVVTFQRSYLGSDGYHDSCVESTWVFIQPVLFLIKVKFLLFENNL